MITKNALAVLLPFLCVPLSAQTTQPTARPGTEAGKVDKKEPEPAAASPFTGAKLDEKVYAHFGAGAHEGKAQSVNEVLGAAKANEGKPIRVAGTIQSVCQKKGCWIRVSDGGDDIFVKFKGYAFFVPKDAGGKQVVLEGTFTVEEQSVDEQKHYLEDAGKKEEAAKVVAPKRTFKMMADGVAIRQSAPAKDGKESKDGEPVPAPAAGTKK